MRGRSFVDTNVLVYLYDSDNPTKRARAGELVTEYGPSGKLVLSTQVLQEFFVTVTRKLARPLSLASAEQAVRHLSTYPVVAIDVQLVLGAIETMQAHRISLWDALIVEAARQSACEELLTEDLSDGASIAGVRVRNPFA